MADDQGWGDLSIHGNEDLQTPRIDELARSGARLENFYVCPVCSPTRAEMLTGRYHPRSGVYSTSAGGERIDLDERTLGDLFQAGGYATACFGKWHNGSQYPYHPNARGFEEYYGFPSGHWGHYFDWLMERNGKLVQGDGFLIDDLTDHALQFIDDHQEEPFFCYLAYNTPHSPMQVPDRFYEKFAGAELSMHHRDPEKEDLPHIRAALAMCENIDWNVGRILDHLDQHGLAEDTVVVYLSDNGPNGWRWNGGMRGRKGRTDEGGVRSPCFIRYPKRIAPETKVDRIGGAVDLLPTLADFASVKVPRDRPLDGKSLAPLLAGEAADWPDRMIFSHWRDRVSVRTQKYRLDHKGRLYDIDADRGQHHDVSDQQPETAERLRAAVEKWRGEVLNQLDRSDRPFPVGHPEFPMTHLPARDGIAHGSVERSNRFPNASFFRDWTSTDGHITWDIEVNTPGSYEVVVDYTCPEKDLGSTVELSFQDASVRGKVSEAFDPPLVGSDQDRTPRQESYVKRFKPLRLGVMPLKAGRGTLTLRALEMPGDQVMDVRFVHLRLIGDPRSPVDHEQPLETIRTDFGLADGPAWDGRRTLYVPDVRGEKLYSYAPDQDRWSVQLESAGRLSATFYQLGQLYLADNGGHRILTLRDGESPKVLSEFAENERPNDLVVDRRGGVYVTLTHQGEVRYVASDGSARTVAEDLETPNGIILSPDGTQLYVSEFAPRRVVRFTVGADGGLSDRAAFAELEGVEAKGADGMCVDRAGNVYCAGPESIWIWSPSGRLLDRIVTPTRPINCTLAGDRRDLYITGFGGVYRQPMRGYGRQPHPPAHGSAASGDQRRPATAIPDSVNASLDVVYDTVGDRRLLADLFVPAGRSGPLPAVVVVHGGGWLKGDKNKFRALSIALAKRGYVTAAIEYRLGYEANFPAAVRDGNAAVRFLRSQASRYQIDPERIAAVGGSAGGHLVGLMAAAPHAAELHRGPVKQEPSAELQAAVVMAGPLQTTTGSVAERSRKASTGSNAYHWIGGTLGQRPEQYLLADAHRALSADCPPILFLSGEKDNPQRNEASRKKLRRLGVPVELVTHPDATHGHWNRHPYFEQVVEDIDTFLKKHL